VKESIANSSRVEPIFSDKTVLKPKTNFKFLNPFQHSETPNVLFLLSLGILAYPRNLKLKIKQKF